MDTDESMLREREAWKSVFIRGKELLPHVEVALEQDGRGHFIDFLLALVAPDIALDENPVGHGRGQAFVPQFDRYGDGGFQRAGEYLHLLGGRTVAAVHVARQA